MTRPKDDRVENESSGDGPKRSAVRCASPLDRPDTPSTHQLGLGCQKVFSLLPLLRLPPAPPPPFSNGREPCQLSFSKEEQERHQPRPNQYGRLLENLRITCHLEHRKKSTVRDPRVFEDGQESPIPTGHQSAQAARSNRGRFKGPYIRIRGWLLCRAKKKNPWGDHQHLG